MTEWTTEWPTTKGWYWFYGWDFGRGRSGREEPTLYPVRIKKVSNGYMYVCEGYFIYKGQAEGLWLPIRHGGLWPRNGRFKSGTPDWRRRWNYLKTIGLVLFGRYYSG